jgi:hypothetical protein
VSEQPEHKQTEHQQTEPDAGQPPAGVGPSPTDAVAVDPQRLIRIASVTREVLEEARRIRPEAGAVDHLRRLHEKIHDELREALPPELFEEFDELTPDIKEGTLEELALGHAEILGWLEGLFQGTQIAMQLQAMRAFSEAQRRQLPDGGAMPQVPGQEGQPPPGGRDPRYL